MKTSENMKDFRLMQSEVPCFWYSLPAAEFDFDGNLGQEKLNLRPVPRTVLTALACRRLGWIRVAIGRCCRETCAQISRVRLSKKVDFMQKVCTIYII